MNRNFFAGVALAALVIPAAASAQETTSIVRGTVSGANGAPVEGAQVTITHVPSGTRSVATTDASGAFTASGLRVGGPFTIDVSSPQGSAQVTDIYTVVGQPYTLPVQLQAEEIVVRASRVRGAGVTSDGPQTVLTPREISRVASINRDVRDLERRSPFATLDLTNSRAVAFAGVNPRFNHFTINGVTVGDTFGLNPDASPTGRGPIPFDAIGQFSVSIAPYDFRQGNFTGGAIDTVLKSGTNDFHGTGFYSQSRDELQGDRIGSNRFTLQNYNSQTYGATLSGPIIRDKLFFMVSGERNTDPRPLSPSTVSQVPNLTQAMVDSVVATAKSKYDYDAGTVLQLSENKDEKIVGRIDWNITDRQKLSLSYINAYDQFDSLQNSSTSSSSPSLGLSSDAYRTSELLRAGIVQLNSDWTDNFSTEARGIYRSTTRGQEPLSGRGFGQFTVCTDPTSTGSATSCSTGQPSISFGPDISRQTNTLFFDTWDGSLLTRLRIGGHELKLLTEFSENRTSNNFLQYSAGGFYFDSLADYAAGNASRLQYASALNGQPDGAAANFHYDQWTFGLQDDWQVLSNLTLTYGVRYDLYGERDAPTANPYFEQRYGFSNTKTYKGLDIFQPRISFDYKPKSNVNVRGGVGVFGGGSPDIYLSNSFSNTILSNQVTFQRAASATGCTPAGVPTDVCSAALNGVNGKTIPQSVQDYVRANATSLQNSNTAALDPNFKLPSVWKANLSGDITLFGIDFGADYLFTKTREAVVFTDIRSQVMGTLPDGRPRYGPITNATDTNYDILLTNTSKGRSHIGVIRFDKEFHSGLSLGGSYTLEDVRDVAAAPASTPLSNYGYQAYGDPNIPAYGTSTNQTTWAFKYNVGYDHAFFGDYRTVFQLFGETRAGQPYSFTMQDQSGNRSQVFGTISQNYRYLLYVPTGPSDPLVTYDSPATQTALDNLINSTALKNYRGKIAPKNIARSRAFTRIDLHLEQEIPTFIGHSRISLFGDIENLPNLLNKNWGGLRQIGYPYTGSVVQVQCLQTPGGAVSTSAATPCVQYKYSSFTAPNDAVPQTSNSLYLIRIGARFTF